MFYVFKNVEDCGQFFISLGIKVYKGMIIGEYNWFQDLEINVCKIKQFINMCFVGVEELDMLQVLVQMMLECVFEYIGFDEMFEVIFELICLCKFFGKKLVKFKC